MGEPSERSAPKKRGYLSAALVIVLIALIVGIYAGSVFRGEKTADESLRTQSAAAEASDEETRLAAILSSIRGAGRVRVMVTYESGPKIVPAQVTQLDTDSRSDSNGESNSLSETRRETSQPATNGGDSVVVLQELSPVIKGVVVVAQGADDISVRLNLLRAAVTALQIDESRVDVFAMAAE